MFELNRDNYFESKDYMSTSLWKKFNECELGGLTPFPSPTDAMLIGGYVDAWVSGDLDKFIEEHPEIISTRGPTKGELKAGFKKAEEIIEYMKARPTLMRFFQDQTQVVMTGDIAGVPMKIMMDGYSKGIAINDLKIMRTVTNRSGQYIDFISEWGYQYQGAIYQEIVRQNTGERLPFFIVAVTKETPINSVIVNVPQEILDTALKQVEETIVRYWKIYNGVEEPIGCGICPTCIEKRKDVPIISMYELMEGVL